MEVCWLQFRQCDRKSVLVALAVVVQSRSAAESGGTAVACGAAGLLTGSERPGGSASKSSGAKLKSAAVGSGSGPLVVSRLRVCLSGNTM